MDMLLELKNKKCIDFLPLVRMTGLTSSLADYDPLGNIGLLLQKTDINDVQNVFSDGKTAVKSSFVALF